MLGWRKFAVLLGLLWMDIETPRVFKPLLNSARYKGAHGGRGSGKSHFLAELLIEDHMLNPGFRSVCIREVQNSLSESVKRLLEIKIDRMGVGRHFRTRESVIEAPGGGLIMFKGMQSFNAENIKSLEDINRAWVEEAQTLSQKSLKILRPTIRSPGSQLWFSWNPNYPTDPVDAFLRGTPPSSSIVVQANYMDNPFLPIELRNEMLDDFKNRPDDAPHIWLGEYINRSSASVFKRWKVEAFETPSDAIIRLGADWGFSPDPAVLISCWISGNNLFIDHEAYSTEIEIDDLPALFAGDCPSKVIPSKRWANPNGHKGVPGALKWKITADSARPDLIKFMKRKGFMIVPAVKGPGSVEDGIDFVRNYNIIIHPRCVNAIREVKGYCFVVDKLTGEITSQLADKDNHVIDSIRYAVENVRRSNYQMTEGAVNG